MVNAEPTVLNVVDDRKCPDGGYCHHGCSLSECFRVRYCEPLSAFGVVWPVRVRLVFGELELSP